MIGVRLCSFCKNATEMILCPFSAHHIKGFMILIYLTIGDSYLDHLVKVAPAGFAMIKLLCFPLY